MRDKKDYDKEYIKRVKKDPVRYKRYLEYQKKWHSRVDVKERKNKRLRENYLINKNNIDFKRKISYYQRKSRFMRKIEAFKHYSNGEIKCIKCGFTDIRALALDHINNDAMVQKTRINSKNPRHVTGYLIYRDLKKMGYPKGYQILCYNCNWIKYIEHMGFSFNDINI